MLIIRFLLQSFIFTLVSSSLVLSSHFLSSPHPHVSLHEAWSTAVCERLTLAAVASHTATAAWRGGQQLGSKWQGSLMENCITIDSSECTNWG